MDLSEVPLIVFPDEPDANGNFVLTPDTVANLFILLSTISTWYGGQLERCGLQKDEPATP